MTIIQRPWANNVAVPRAMLSPTRWNELHDFIELAQDALGDTPDDFDQMFFENCEMQLVAAQQILASRRHNDRPWAEAARDESPTVQRIREAMRIIRNFAYVIDAQGPKEGQFGIPSVTLDLACCELAEALRIEHAA